MRHWVRGRERRARDERATSLEDAMVRESVVRLQLAFGQIVEGAGGVAEGRGKRHRAKAPGLLSRK